MPQVIKPPFAAVADSQSPSNEVCHRLVHIEGHTVYATILEADKFLPAAGQGAIAIEARAGDARVTALLGTINHADTQTRVTAEREFLRILGAGCQTPVGARTWIAGDRLHMAVRVFSEQDLAAAPLEFSHHETLANPVALAAKLAGRVQSATFH